MVRKKHESKLKVLILIKTHNKRAITLLPMDNKLPYPNISVLRPNMSGVSTNARRLALPCDPGRNLHIEIDFETPHSHIKDSGQILELLCDEICLWAKSIGKRKLKSISLLHPAKKLASFEITRFMYCIASHFHVDQLDKIYMLVTDTDELTSEYLALLRGLNFNSLRLVINESELLNSKKLCETVNSIRAFCYNHIGIHIHHTDCLDEICQQIKSIEKLCQPDHISIGHQSNPVLVSGSFGPLLINKTEDVLRLGTEGKSLIREIPIQNYASFEKYKSAIECGNLPIHPL